MATVTIAGYFGSPGNWTAFSAPAIETDSDHGAGVSSASGLIIYWRPEVDLSDFNNNLQIQITGSGGTVEDTSSVFALDTLAPPISLVVTDPEAYPAGEGMEIDVVTPAL